MDAAKDRHQPDSGLPRQRDHPVVGLIGLLAILITIALLVWARVAVIGTRDIEEALIEPSSQDTQGRGAADERRAPARDVDDAVTSSRWATGFSP